MIKLYSNTLGAEIVESATGRALGKIADFIFHPDTGKLEGIIVETGKLLSRKKILSPLDIEEWKLKIYVKDEDALTTEEEIIRVKEILEKGIFIINNSVITKDDITLGRVADYTFDNAFLKLTHLYVEKNILGVFSHDRKIIPAAEILEITKDAIIVKSNKNYAKEKKKEIIDLEKILTPKPDFELT